MCSDSAEQEEWRDIPGWEGFYQASNIGRVRSLSRIVGPGSRSVVGRILRQNLSGKVYKCWQVGMSRDGKDYKRKVHQLVLEAFIGLRPEGTECCHNNGDALNNRLENLRWDTKKNNQHDKIAHGTTNRGERQGISKLTASQVLEIRALSGSDTQVGIGKQFGVAGNPVGYIISRKNWAHI